MFPFLEKIKLLYSPYVLAILSLSYLTSELGHFLIGVTSKRTATDLHYGDISCQLNNTELKQVDLPILCEVANSSQVCELYSIDNSSYCEWNYNGQGIDYQILAGPSYITVYTIFGVILGIMADKYNRVRMFGGCTLLFGVAVFMMGAVNEYWQLLVLRMFLAAGEAGMNPMATGILSDLFSEEKRGLVMSIFNWGIYGGYGLAFPVGRYITQLDIWELGWRMCYYGTGVLGVVLAALTFSSLREPTRTIIGEESVAKASTTAPAEPATSAWRVMLEPRVIFLCLAASIRHTGGLCFAYNCDLYYLQYFPDYDLGWWLFAVTFGIGSIGVVFGGIISDKFVGKMGVMSRVAILSISQLIATPFAFGSVYFNPLGAMISLGISYFFAEMWFGILFAILVEIVPLSVRSTTVGVFLFVMNNIGGNLPILVEPVRLAFGFREALYIFYVGAYLVSSVMFFCAMFLMKPPKKVETPEDPIGQENPAFTLEQLAHYKGAASLDNECSHL